MNEGTLITDGKRPAVRLERHLSDPPTVVWEAITDRDQLQSWFPCDVEVLGGRWEKGASTNFYFPPDVIDLTLTVEVLVADAPNLLAYSWGEEILRFELFSDDGGTRLVLINELSAGSAARNAAGWDTCLDRMVLGVSPGPNEWRHRFEAYAAAFEPSLGPQEGPPSGYKGSA